MGACLSTANPTPQEQQHHHHIANSGSVSELAKARKVIDGLNVEIENLNKEMSLLRGQVSREKQAKLEETDKYNRAKIKVARLEEAQAILSKQLSKSKINKIVVDAPKVKVERAKPEHVHGNGCEFGQCQSPINIISVDSDNNNSHTVVMDHSQQFAENALRFNYPEKVSNCTIINNGHTVQVNIPDSAKCKLQIYGGEFTLKQFHFHTPSEHTLDSKQFEMEMHLVHVNEQGQIAVLGFIFTKGQRYQKPKLKLSKSRAHLVLAQGKRSRRRLQNAQGNPRADEEEAEESDDLETDDEWEDDEAEEMRIQKEAELKGNDFLAQFWNQLPREKTGDGVEIPLNNSISFDYLFETSSKSMKKNVKSNEIEIDMDIFEYMGSLTTPPYTEGVQWLVSKTTHFINQQQLKELRICWNNHNNARPVQEYFGRQVSLRSKSSLRVV